MARFARVVTPGRGPRATRRVNRREAIYFDLLREQTARCEVQVWADCLMPNHVHLIQVPAHADSPALPVGGANGRKAGML